MLPYGPSFQAEGVGDPLQPRGWRVMAFRFYQRPVALTPSMPAETAALPRMVGPLRIHTTTARDTTTGPVPGAHSAPSQPGTPMDMDEIGTPFFSRSPSAYTDTAMAPPSSLPAKRLNDDPGSTTHTLSKRSRADSQRKVEAEGTATQLAQMAGEAQPSNRSSSLDDPTPLAQRQSPRANAQRCAEPTDRRTPEPPAAGDEDLPTPLAQVPRTIA